MIGRPSDGAAGRRVRCAGLAVLTLLVAAPAAGAAAPSSQVTVRRAVLPATAGGATEAAVAVDPRDGRRIAVLATDYTGYVVTVPAGGQQTRIAPTCRLFTTADGGRSWATQDFPGAHLPDAPYVSASNPSVSVGSDGYVRAVCLPNNAQGGGAVAYASAAFGARLVPAVLPLSPVQAGPVAFPDKPWVTTAPNGRDVTVAWGEFVSNPGYYPQVLARTSHDGGLTFGQPVVVSADTLTTHTGGNLATPLYGRDGQLVVAWHGTAGTATDVGHDDVLVADPEEPGSTVVAVTGIARSGVQGSYPRHANQPSLAQDPRSGRLYLAVGLQTPSGVRAALTTSADGGRRWSAPVIVCPAPAGHNQLNAAVAVNGAGHVAVVFQDVVGKTLTTQLEVLGGRTSPRHITLSRVPTTAQPYTATSNGTAIGDFLSIQANGEDFVTAWPEQRGTLLQLQLAVVSAP